MKELYKKSVTETKHIFQEIMLHKSLRHPNIIKFIDYLETERKVFIFLEYAEKGDLFSFIQKNRKMEEKERIRLFYETCIAIRYMHSNNVMHRDLKPENVLLDGNLKIKVCDFGWSAKYFEEEDRETLCGTFEYMAPEVFKRKRQTKKTDVWALGVLLYELFHGYAPFRGTRLEMVMNQVMHRKPHFKKNINPEIKDIITKALTLNPIKRASAHEILQSKIFAEFRVSVDWKKKLKSTRNLTTSPKIKFNRLKKTSQPKIFPQSSNKRILIQKQPIQRQNSNLSFNNVYKSFGTKKNTKWLNYSQSQQKLIKPLTTSSSVDTRIKSTRKIYASNYSRQNSRTKINLSTTSGSHQNVYSNLIFSQKQRIKPKVYTSTSSLPKIIKSSRVIPAPKSQKPKKSLKQVLIDKKKKKLSKAKGEKCLIFRRKNKKGFQNLSNFPILLKHKEELLKKKGKKKSRLKKTFGSYLKKTKRLFKV